MHILLMSSCHLVVKVVSEVWKLAEGMLMMPLESELLNLHTEQHCNMHICRVHGIPNGTSFKEVKSNHSGKYCKKLELYKANWVSHTW